MKALYSNKKSYVLLMVIAFIATLFPGCSSDEDIQEPVFVFNKPCLQWGLSQSEVKEEMNGFSLLFEDNATLIYKGKDTESLISYNFTANELRTSCVFIQNDLSSLTDITKSFNGYSSLPEYEEPTYTNVQTNTVGEITTVERDGLSYYCIGWSVLNPEIIQAAD